MRISKKIWPEHFELMSKGLKTVELRLADFKIEIGDEIHLMEWDPLTEKYTGRKLIKNVERLTHVHLTDFHTPEEIHEKGHWIIEFGELK